MTYHGTVHNGVVVLQDGTAIPDGAVVTVVLPSPAPDKEAENDARTIWQKLADLGRQVESEPCDLPTDLAANHDHYLYGLPKKS